MPVLGCGRTPAGIYFFAMELAAGDLQQQVARRAPVKQIIAWMKQATFGVQCAHRGGVIHCDLKPSNLLLTRDKHVVVSDFGLAMRAEGIDDSLPLAGTPAFMAPEQAAPHWGRVSPASDIYSLGATLYALLTGRPPFTGQRASEILAQLISPSAPIPPAALRPRLNPEINRICLKCLEKRPADRFESIEALRETLANL
jgi:serine/threonine-protein kinase